MGATFFHIDLLLKLFVFLEKPKITETETGVGQFKKLKLKIVRMFLFTSSRLNTNVLKVSLGQDAVYLIHFPLSSAWR